MTINDRFDTASAGGEIRTLRVERGKWGGFVSVAAAVFLSCIGIYGLMSYLVRRRTSEIGIRMALGAARSNVCWLVMRDVVLLIAIGIVVGVPATLIGSRLVSTMLYGLKPPIRSA